LTPGNANASEQLKEHVEGRLGNPNVQPLSRATKSRDTAKSPPGRERKIILALGNIAGVASVDDQITVTGPVVAARFVVVKKATP
jgi:hypothetical protein